MSNEGKLRTYQELGVQTMLTHLRERGCVYNASEPGLGKSLMTIETINRLFPGDFPVNVLVICPAVVALVWEKELEKWCKNQKAADSYTIISYDKARRDDYLKWLKEVQWQVLILDEAHFCLDEASEIQTEQGVKKLKDVRVGERVWSFSNNVLRLNRIINKFEGDERFDWCEILFSDGTVLKALTWHKVLTTNGWKKAGELEISDNVQMVQEGLGCDLPLFRRAQNFLQPPLQETMALPQGGMVRADAGQQPDEETRHTFKSQRHIESSWAPTKDQRGERERANRTGKENETHFGDSLPKNSGLSRVSGWLRPKIERLSYLLQARSCDTVSHVGSGNRWALSQLLSAKKAGQKKRKEVKTARVVSNKIHQSGSGGNSRPRFIDIEVERDHSYIANGVVVHNCKSPKAIRTKVILKHFWPKIPYKIALSGTPFTQSIMDVWPVFSRMAPEDFGNYWTFADQYCNIKKTPWGDKYEGVKNHERLKKIIKEKFFFRFLKKDVEKELPEKSYQKIFLGDEYRVKLSNDQEERHELYVKLLREAIAKGTMPPPPPVAIATEIKEQGLKKVPAITAFCKNLLDGGEPCVIFAWHREVIAQLKESLKAYNPQVIQGETTLPQRKEAVDKFQDGTSKCFIGQLKAAGTGITLTRSSTVVLAELSWSPADILQGTDRVHRISQRNPVTIYTFPVLGSVDEKIENVLLSKIEVFEKVLG